MQNLNLQDSTPSSDEKEDEPDLEILDGPDFDPVEFLIGEYQNDEYDEDREEVGRTV